jgi:hypothetical protein
MFVAFTVNSDLSNVYGKSASNVMFIFVFKVGLAESGVSTIPAFVVVMVVNSRVFATT